MDFCAPASKSLGNKRNDIRHEDIERILNLYLDFKENEYCKICDNSFFGSFQLTIEQPLRNADGELVLRRHEKQADASKRDYESVPLDVDYQTYFEDQVLPFIDPDSWIDVSKTRINFEINFTQLFSRSTVGESSDVLARRIQDRESEIREFMKRIFG